jgi:hypothetical protein
MVRGIDKFKAFFGDYAENYVVIGGTACDIIMEENDFIPRATKDIDLILVVEALSPEFVKQFWKFIKLGNYEDQQKSTEEKNYYRFIKPENKSFPYQLEFFSRIPDAIDFEGEGHLVPIPVEGHLSSLSAVLMDDDYYHYMIRNSSLEAGVHIANLDALICLKAKAYLDIQDRLNKGSNEDKKQLKKHKHDVFKLAVLLTTESSFELPEKLKNDMLEFMERIKTEIPDKAIYKSIGAGTVNSDDVVTLIRKCFLLNEK